MVRPFNASIVADLLKIMTRYLINSNSFINNVYKTRSIITFNLNIIIIKLFKKNSV